MALEDLNGPGKYISDLVVTNPAGTDVKSKGDDHLRGIKNTLRNTFPNVEGPVNASHEELSYCQGLDGNIQDALDTKPDSSILGDIFVGQCVLMPVNVFNWITTNVGKVWLRCDGSKIPNNPDNQRLITALGYGATPNDAYVPNYTGAANPAQPIGTYQEIIMVIKI